MKPVHAAVALAAVLAAACSSESKDDHKRPELRAALDQSTISLTESIDIAVAQTTAGSAFEAALVLGTEPIFAVGTVESVSTLEEFRVSGVSGAIVGQTPMSGSAPGACPGQISLTEALAIAEAEANGEAVASVPDDDVACAREIQILAGETLWEVKVAGDGAILEHELSDEYSGAEDDD